MIEEQQHRHLESHCLLYPRDNSSGYIICQSSFRTAYLASLHTKFLSARDPALHSPSMCSNVANLETFSSYLTTALQSASQ